MMWKILNAQIKDEIYYSLEKLSENRGDAVREQEEQMNYLIIDKHIIKETKTMQKNMAGTWIDYKKARL